MDINKAIKEYDIFIRQAEMDLSLIRLRGTQLIAEMIVTDSDKIYGTDLFFCGIVDKSSFLIDGIINAVKEKNLIILGILLRAQIDNCLRAFALTLVDDPHDLALKVLAGESIRKIADKDGKKMTDSYLTEKLSAIDNKIKSMYKTACGYVHFSEKGILHTLHTKGFPSIEITVGKTRNEDINIITEGYYAFLHFTNLLYEKQLGGWIITKSQVAR